VGGWDTVFYIFGSCGILWYPIWLLYAHERPEDHPGISAEELAYINRGKDLGFGRSHSADGDRLLNADADSSSLHQPLTDGVEAEPSLMDGQYTALVRHNTDDRMRALSTSVVSVDGGVGEAEGTRANDQEVLSDEVPWAAILSSPAVWVIFVQGWCHGWINLTLLSEMPSYLTDQLGFDLSAAGALSTLPYVMLFCAVIGLGNVFHWLQEKHRWSTRSIRLTAQFIAFIGASLGLIICGYLKSVPAAFVFMILAQGSTGAVGSGFACAFLDIAPNHSPLLNSITNTIGSGAGILGPIVVGLMTSAYPGIVGWRLVFFITAAQCVFALVLWYFYQHSDVIPEINIVRVKVSA
jgi:hypothetical protein